MSTAPVTDGLDAARAALRQRQGAGARYDAANAPACELSWARRGTAYFARLLNALSDADLDAPSAVEGVPRREIVAHVGYHARAVSEIIAWARQHPGLPLPTGTFPAAGDIRRKATQPARALRNLFAHAEIHLNVEWRDLDETQWDAVVEDAGGQRFAIRETPWMRARVIWLHALDLDAGGRLADVPPDLAEHMAQLLSARYGDRLEALEATTCGTPPAPAGTINL